MRALPPITEPNRYEGLFVYDFGDHVSVGYTAAEVRTLRRAPAHGRGTAFQIYRVDERGRIELRGISDADLSATEAMCFLRTSGEAARRDYDTIVRAAYADPLPCPCELRLMRSPAFSPSDLSALVYPTWAAHAIATWLGQRASCLGDTVHGGPQAYQRLQSSDGLTISSCDLPPKRGFADRPEAEVLAAIDRPLQR